MNLRKSEVVFDEVNHKYFLNGKELSGITKMLSKHVFAGKYRGIPEYILQRAAEMGKYIHRDCELADMGMDPETEEGKVYLKLRDFNDLKIAECEYIVTDNEYFASPIDKVFQAGKNEVDLGDIKTTCELDKKYLSWQLSIYAFLFELQNPYITVRKLYGIWLKGNKGRLVEVNRIDPKVIRELLLCEIEGRTFVYPLEFING